MKKKYCIKFGKLNNIKPYVEKCNENYSVISRIADFENIEQLKLIINTNYKNIEKLDYKEFMSNMRSFIRIWFDKVEIGQYDDDFFSQMEEFKDYVDEGEKIYGSIPTEDFLEIIKEWKCFVEESLRSR